MAFADSETARKAAAARWASTGARRSRWESPPPPAVVTEPTIWASTTTADRALVIELWDASTEKPPMRKKAPAASQRGNLRRFAEWCARDFGQAECCRLFSWTTEMFDRVVGVDSRFDESTAPRRKGAIPKQGVATEAQHSWNDGFLYGAGRSRTPDVP